MNKNETKKDARRMLKNAEAEFKLACVHVGACLNNEVESYRNNALKAMPHLLHAKASLEDARGYCKFGKNESAVSVRNAWMHVLFRAKQVRDEIDTIQKNYIIFTI